MKFSKKNKQIIYKNLNKMQNFNQDDLAMKDHKNRNYLHITIKYGNYDLLYYLTNKYDISKIINEKDKKGNTPLHYCCYLSEPYRFIKLLLKFTNLDINCKDNKDYTPLHILCTLQARLYKNLGDKDSYIKSINLLLNQPNICIDYTNKYGLLPIDIFKYN